jgi:hypothetical protein
VIFHDATLAAIAALTPCRSRKVPGARKLEAYGEDVLRVVAQPDLSAD